MIDRDSDTWQTVKRWAETALRENRIALESPTCGPEEGHRARGAILTLTGLLSLTQPKAPLSEPARLDGDRSGY